MESVWTEEGARPTRSMDEHKLTGWSGFQAGSSRYEASKEEN